MNGIYQFEVHYFQNGEHGTWTRSLELRQIPEPSLQIAEQPSGAFLVSWDAPPDYVEVTGFYMAMSDTADFLFDEFGIIDGSSITIDSGEPLSYVYVDISFTDPGGSSSAQVTESFEQFFDTP